MLIRQSMRKMWSDSLKNLRGVEVWWAAPYVNPRAGMTVEALTDRESKLANMSLENEKMLRCKTFLPNDGNQYYELPPARYAHTHVTKQAVERAVYGQSVKNAPVPDKLSFGTIRLL